MWLVNLVGSADHPRPVGGKASSPIWAVFRPNGTKHTQKKANIHKYKQIYPHIHKYTHTYTDSQKDAQTSTKKHKINFIYHESVKIPMIHFIAQFI